MFDPAMWNKLDRSAMNALVTEGQVKAGDTSAREALFAAAYPVLEGRVRVFALDATRAVDELRGRARWPESRVRTRAVGPR